MLDREEKLRRHRIASRKYFLKNRERINQYHKALRARNRGKISEYGFRLRARPETQERIKKWREDNKEHLKAYNKRPDRKEKKRLSDKKYWEKVKNNPERHKKHLERQKKIREENREIIRKYNQKYYTSLKGKINYTHHNHRRLALIKQRETNMTNKKVRGIINRDKVCVYCGSNKRLELDHIVPISKGGSCNFNNFVLACKSCNCRKSDREVFFWCMKLGIQVPKIVKELLTKQKLGIQN